MSAVFVDHYAVLGVGRNASMKEINDAWKRLALKYHPDKCNRTEDGIEKFRSGREAVEILRDPLRRRELDRQLDARATNHRASATGWGGYQPQPSAGHFWSNAQRNSHRDHTTGPRFVPEYKWCRKGRRGNGFDGSSRIYRSEAQMDEIFEMVKARERERLAAEARKAAQAEAEPETHHEQVKARERERRAAEPRNATQAEAKPEIYREPVQPVKRPWGGDDHASIELEERKARAERRKKAFRARVMRDEEELASESDEISFGNASNTVYPSTVYGSAKSSPRQSSDFNGGFSPAATLSSLHYGPTQSDGSYLADSRVEDQSEDPNGSDTIDRPPAVPNHDPASSGPSSGPSSGLVSPEHHRVNANPVPDVKSRGAICAFFPYIKAMLNDPSGCYTLEDMHKELKGLMMETMCNWMEDTRRSRTNSSHATGTTDGSACSHTVFWHKQTGQVECPHCHCWKPLFVLSCSGCGLKKCVRCKFENTETKKVIE